MAKIRVGVVGTGWGELQLEAFKRAHDLQVSALCDVDAARLKDVAATHKIDRTFADYADLVKSGDVDLISIASPPDLHVPMAQAAVDAGKHVLVEKPLALDARAAADLLASAQARGIVHAVDFEMRFLPGLAYCKELIDEGYLGTLLRVDVTMGLERPWGEHGNWAADDARGGGVLMELGLHFVDLLLWWFGDVRAVSAGRRTHFPTVRLAVPQRTSKDPAFVRSQVTGDDAAWCVLQFARGGEALLSLMSGARREVGWNMSAYGSTGALIVESGQLMGMREGDREIGLLPIPKRLELGDNPKDPLMWSMARLAERVAARINHAPDAKPFPDFRDGVAAAQVIDAIRRASEVRGWAEVKS